MGGSSCWQRYRLSILPLSASFLSWSCYAMLLLSLLLLAGCTVNLPVVTSFTISSTSTTRRIRPLIQADVATTTCWGKAKRGSLIDSFADGGDYDDNQEATENMKPSTASASAASSRQTKKSSKTQSSVDSTLRPSKPASSVNSVSTQPSISPALMEWMTGNQQQQIPTKSQTGQPKRNGSEEEPASTSFAPFDTEKPQLVQRRGRRQEVTLRTDRNRPLSSLLVDEDDDKDLDAVSTDVDEQIALNVKELEELVSSSSIPMVKVLDQIRSLLKIVSAQYQSDIDDDGVGLISGRGRRRSPRRNQRQPWMVNSVRDGAITGSNMALNYRLAWVGSDAVVCHVGTGLHKVPLARLQEIFLSLQPRNRIQLLEVIRVLGPFPNVKNVLQGTHESTLMPTTPVMWTNQAHDVSNEQFQFTLPWQLWEITWTSMVDGMGKEILAETADQKRKVSLQVSFCHPQVIVAVVPPTSKSEMSATGKGKMTTQQQSQQPPKSSQQQIRKDPLEENGANVLVFVRDNEMDNKLDKLRVL